MTINLMYMRYHLENIYVCMIYIYIYICAMYIYIYIILHLVLKHCRFFQTSQSSPSNIAALPRHSSGGFVPQTSVDFMATRDS